MNTPTSSHQDMGPLIWVRGEIDLALIRAAEALGDVEHQPGAEQLKFAQTHLHQARGALAIVGLDGLTHFSDALEQLFADWHAGRLTSTRGAATTGTARDFVGPRPPRRAGCRRCRPADAADAACTAT
jgi:hypothetical protein